MQFDFQSRTATEPILEQNGGFINIFDHNIQITIVVQTRETHATTALLSPQSPFRCRGEAPGPIIAQGLVFLHQFVTRQMSKNTRVHHAIDDMEVEGAIIVQIPELH